MRALLASARRAWPRRPDPVPASAIKIAAVTTAYDEPDLLPIWLRHYARELGPDHCFVVDHGSDDGSTDDLAGANRVRLPRSPHDNRRRARFVSAFCSALLLHYDRVIYSDADELVLADPAVAPSLRDLLAAEPAPVLSAVGFDLIQADEEEPYDPSRPILRQRGWIELNAPMSKPAAIGRPVRWTPGFHRANAPVRFVGGGLLLFHLRWFDREIAARRLVRTRAQPWASPTAAWYQRVDDEKGREIFAFKAGQARRPEAVVGPGSPDVAAALAAMLGRSAGRRWPRTFDKHYTTRELWPVPERLRDLF